MYIIKSNRGFSLIEVLVTVGLVGILVGIAIPSYNGYKKSTVSMALKADLGNGAKVYNAQYAMESTYCYDLTQVGLTNERGGNPIYKKNAYYGFESVETDCAAVDTAKINFKSAGGFCKDAANKPTGDGKTACDTDTKKSWASSPDLAFSGKTGECKLDSNKFRLGATTNVSGLDDFLTADQDGRIYTTSDDCDNTGY